MENINNNHGISGFSDDSSIDFKRYVSLFISNWYWFAFGLFLSLTIAYGINRYSERIYTVSSSLLIKDEQFGGDASQLGNIFPGGQMFKTQQNLNNEIGILKSFNLNKRVIDSLPLFHIEYTRIGRRNIVERRLYDDAIFQVIPENDAPQPTGKILLRITPDEKCMIKIDGLKEQDTEIAVGELFDKHDYCFRIFPRNPGQRLFNKDLSNKYSFQFLNPSSVANNYRSKLSITPISETASLVILSVSGSVAEQEADYLNKLMDLYILQGMELKYQTADSAIDFIDEQIKEIREKLTEEENKLEEFRQKNQLIDISTEGAYLQRELETLGKEMALLGLQQSYFEYLKSYLDTKSPVTDLISPSVVGVGDQMLITLVQELSGLQHQRNLLRMNLSESTVPVETIEADLLRKKDALRDNIEGAEISISNAVSSLKSRIINIEKDIDRLPSTEKELIRIQRSFEVNNTVYTYLLEKQAETRIAKASTVSDNRVIDNSNSFNKSQISPKESKNVLMAFIFGMLFPAVVLLLIDSLNNKVIDKTDVEKRTDFPIIGYINHNENKSEIPVQEKPSSILAESFRLIRTNLKYFIRDVNNPVIAISSTISAEGKTFISINMATIFAMLGKKVLLVGLDLRKPRIHKVLEVENGLGLSTFLSGEIGFNDIIQKTRIENLYYAPSGPVPPNPAELIASERMKLFIAEAREKYDFVVIDTPPIAIVTDALLISSLVDMYLLVVRQRYTSKSTLDLIQEMYKNKTIRNAGIVINDISRSGYYGYGIRYGYYSSYGYSYGYSYYNAGYGSYTRGSKKKGNDYYLE